MLGCTVMHVVHTSCIHDSPVLDVFGYILIFSIHAILMFGGSALCPRSGALTPIVVH